MKTKSRIKLTTTQYMVLETIRKEGKYGVRNNQNPTVKKLIALGVCKYNSDYNALLFTELGETFQL